MTDMLQGLLLGYLKENNPELLRQLEIDDSLHAWVLDKLKEVELVLQDERPMHDPEKACMSILTIDLAPARLRYLRDLLEERFPEEHERMLATGLLEYELVQLSGVCRNIFDDHLLVPEMDNPQLDRLAVAIISDHLYHNYR